MAWLGSRPGKREKTRAAIFASENEDSPFLQLPPVLYFNYLIQDLVELGFKDSGYGDSTLSFQTIAAWAAVTKTAVTVWEALTLRQLSSTYLIECEKAKEEHAEPPYSPAVEAEPEVLQKANSKLATMLRNRTFVSMK